MESLKLVGLFAGALIGGGVLGSVVTAFSKKRVAKESLEKTLTPSEKARLAADDEELAARGTANFNLNNWIVEHAEFVRFDPEWNNGTGYFNALQTANFVGVKKGALLYSVCPTTCRMVVVINKRGENGENIVFFKRYTEHNHRQWACQGGVEKHEDVLKLNELEGIDIVELHTQMVEKILKHYVGE